MRPTRDDVASADSLAPHVDLVRLAAEAALVRRFNAGYGFADARIPAEVYVRDEALRERLGRDSLRPRDTHRAQAEEIEQALAAARAVLDGHSSPLQILSRRFDLDACEQALVAIAVAYEIDRDVRELCHALAGRRQGMLFADVCQELAPELAATAALLGVLHPNGSLRQHCLIEVDAPLGAAGQHASPAKLDCVIELDRGVLDWLLGDARLAEPLDSITQVLTPERDLHVYLDPAVVAQIEQVAARLGAAAEPRGGAAEPPLVLLQGAEGAGKRAAAHRLAALLGRSVAVTPVPAALEAARHSRDALLMRRVLSQARLRGAVPYLPGIETLRGERDRNASSGDAERGLGLGGMDAIARYRDIAVLGTRDQGALALPAGRPFHLIRMPPAPLAVRRRAWEHSLAAVAELATTAAEEAGDWAARYVLGPGAIGEVVSEACGFARATDTAVRRDHIEEAVGRRLTMRLGPLGNRITRRARLDEMVLSEDALETLNDMIAMVRERSQILERWGYGRHLGLSRGVSALFSGEPGTGKTMAASAISGVLGLDLFRIDLSAVTSKWVGETEKHLARIFDEAQSANAMLLFDEADSLFGKRTELKSAQDRYANLEVNYVLQRMESFDGVSVLTTNFESAIDPAFLRRLNFRIRFPAPEVDERLELWRRLLPPQTGLGEQVDFAALAERFVMTGGHIRNAIVRAAVIAAREGRDMKPSDLTAGAHREYVELGKVMPSL